jgi:hypothetical protein
MRRYQVHAQPIVVVEGHLEAAALKVETITSLRTKANGVDDLGGVVLDGLLLIRQRDHRLRGRIPKITPLFNK